MSDFKSKLPDLQELGSMGSKLYKAIKGGVCEIIADYKKKREEPKEAVKEEVIKEASPEPTKEEPKKAAPKAAKAEPKVKAQKKESSED